MDIIEFIGIDEIHKIAINVGLLQHLFDHHFSIAELHFVDQIDTDMNRLRLQVYFDLCDFLIQIMFF